MPPNEICLCGHKRHLHAPERGAASNLEGAGACSMIGYNPSTHEGMPCGCRFFRTAETVNVAIAGTGEAAPATSTHGPSMMTDGHIREAAKLLNKIAQRENDIAAIELDIKRQQDDVTRYRSDIDTMKAQVDIYRAGRSPDDDMPF